MTGSGGTTIGYHQAWDVYFTGVIHQVSIGTTAFSANQVKGLYLSRPSTPSQPPPM